MRFDGLTERFVAALSYAARVHGESGGHATRKGTSIPYISHPLAVASIVMEHGGTEDEVIGALLHDVAEDLGGQAALTEIERMFGAAAAAIVRGCSDDLPSSEDEKAPWEERKQKYLAHLSGADYSIMIVSAADKLHNLRCIVMDYRELGDKLWERFSAGKSRSLWYYGSLVRIFLDSALPVRLRRELEGVYQELERLTREPGEAGKLNSEA